MPLLVNGKMQTPHVSKVFLMFSERTIIRVYLELVRMRLYVLFTFDC